MGNITFYQNKTLNIKGEIKMNKEDRPVIIMNDTDYAKLCDKLSSIPAGECLGELGMLDYIKVVADAKTEKRLWKVKYVEEEFYGNEYNHAFVDKEKDIRKLTKIEAEEWLYQVQKERNVSYPKLFYKEDGEWVLYKEEK